MNTDPKPWLASYPDGVRWDAELPTMPVAQLLDEAVARWPDRSAIEFMGGALTYRELSALADRAAKGFEALGVRPGVHVGLYLPNTPHYPIAFFGALRAGATVVNYSPLDAERTLAHKIEDSETEVLVTLDLASLQPLMARLVGTARFRTLVVGRFGDFSAHPEAVRARLEAAGQLAPPAGDDRVIGFDRLLDNDGVCTRHPVTDLDRTVVVLQYTGGTTGLPKGAMLTHANLTSAVSQYREANAGILLEGEERSLVVLPLFHIYALTVNLLYGIRLGATSVLHPRFDVEAAVADLIGQRITLFCGVPTMYTALAHHPRVVAGELRTLKFCGSGGAPLPVEVGNRFAELTGTPLNEGWGMTETSPTGTFTPVRGRRKAGSCGMPLPGIELAFEKLGAPGERAAAGEPGELLIRGPNVMIGYWKNPGATASAMTADGHFRTGDVARMDADGFVFIVDRTKDMLLCSGFNVYPRVIEEAIYEHPSVEEVCVIGVPDPYRGESPKAYVKLRTGAEPLTLEALQAFLAARLGKHEMVQALELRTELPKSPVGKLLKKVLVDEEAGRRAA